MQSIDLVIAYYKEDLDWLNEYKYRTFRNIYVYTKGKDPPNIMFPHKVIKLENIGRNDHTYLYHIIEHYDDLADVTIFTTGSASLEHKNKKLKFLVDKSFDTETSVFKGPRFANVRDDNYDFTVGAWEATHASNKDDSHQDLKISEVRPFGKWYDKNFPNVDVTIASYYGLFSVSKKHVHNHSKEYYIKLMKEFPRHSNPEVGHYFERAWVAIFHPIPQECIYYDETTEGFDDYIPSFKFFLVIIFSICILIILSFLMRVIPKRQKFLRFYR